MKIRCSWVNMHNELYIKYHDEEWGVPSYNDEKLFEMLVLEGMQAGLSWDIILKKRENLRLAFDNFNARKIADYDNDKINQLLKDPGIIRNKCKIIAAIKNANAYLWIKKEYPRFTEYIWQFVSGIPIVNSWSIVSEIPVNSHQSDIMSKDLKKRGFSFVGSTICYSFMQAVGMVNDHTVDCFRYHEINNKYNP